MDKVLTGRGVREEWQGRRKRLMTGLICVRLGWCPGAGQTPVGAFWSCVKPLPSHVRGGKGGCGELFTSPASLCSRSDDLALTVSLPFPSHPPGLTLPCQRSPPTPLDRSAGWLPHHRTHVWGCGVDQRPHTCQFLDPRATDIAGVQYHAGDVPCQGHRHLTSQHQLAIGLRNTHPAALTRLPQGT